MFVVPFPMLLHCMEEVTIRARSNAAQRRRLNRAFTLRPLRDAEVLPVTRHGEKRLERASLPADRVAFTLLLVPFAHVSLA